MCSDMSKDAGRSQHRAAPDGRTRTESAAAGEREPFGERSRRCGVSQQRKGE